MPYVIVVKPAQDRRALIEEACKNPVEMLKFYHYQDKERLLPVVRLPIDVPVYRMENYRTQIEQRIKIGERKLADDFFKAGQEKQAAQAVQHEILHALAKQGSYTVSPIKDVLEQEPQQREPLLTSTSGVVVNGNHRLAAMRELYATGEARFRIFSHVDCMVLPSSATPKEIKDVEVRLQMQPETRLPYGWVEELLAIRDLLQYGHTKREVADLLRKKESDVDLALIALEEVDLYLIERCNTPEDYRAVRKSEQMFKDVSKAFKKKSGEDLEASRAIAQVLAEMANKDDLGTRVYNYNFAFGDKSGTTLSKLADQLGVDLCQSTVASQGEPDNISGLTLVV